VCSVLSNWSLAKDARARCCAAFLPFVSSLFSPAPRVQRAVVVVAPRAMRAAPPPVGGGVIKELI